ncbi:hypothetical protein AB4175_16420 [Vibrio cyclitrophicus]
MAMWVMAFFCPLFAAITYTLSALMVHVLLLTFLIGFVYRFVNRVNHPRFNAWISHPTKPRDFIFDLLVEFLKIMFFLAPCLYFLFGFLGYEQDAVNKASLPQLVVMLSYHLWEFWLITHCFCVYKQSVHNQ